MMGVIATAVKHMLAAGLDENEIISAIAEMEASAVPSKTARQERNRRYYEKHKTSEKRLKASEQDVSDVSDAIKTPLARVEDKPLNTDTNLNLRTTKSSDLSDFKAELTDLDSDRLEAIVKHRRSRKGQITGYSARLFRRDAEACGLSMPEAVDTCISRNWITVKPDWLSKPQSRGSPPQSPKPITAAQLALQRARTGFQDADRQAERDDRSTLVLLPRVSNG